MQIGGAIAEGVSLGCGPFVSGIKWVNPNVRRLKVTLGSL